MLSDKELIKQFVKHKSISEYDLSNQYDLARRAHRFYNGDRGIYTAEVTDQTGDKRTIVFNKIKPYIDSVSGFMRQLRRVFEYSARVDEEEEKEFRSNAANVFSAQIRETANLDYLESAQDKEMLIAGYAAIDTNILYEKNPDGEVQGELVEFDDVGWDPQSRAPNLLDARWIYRRRKLSKDEALKRFKAARPEDLPAVHDPDRQKVYNPYDGQYTAISINNNYEQDLVEIHYYQWWELETYYRANNPIQEIKDEALAQTLRDLLFIVRDTRSNVEDEWVRDDLFVFDPNAATLVMTPTLKEDVVEAFSQYGIVLQTQEYLKKSFYTAILTPEKVLDKYKSPNQDGFTIKVKTDSFDNELKCWYSITRQLQEPSRYANKALTEILYTIAFNSKGGVMYEKMAVDDPQRFEREYASTKAAIRVNDGALSGGMIQPKAMAALPTGYENVYQISNSSLGEVTGVNKEFLGSSENKQVSALLESQRITQVSSTLAGIFDAVSLYQIEQARLLLTYMRILAENRARPINMEGPNGEDYATYVHKELLIEEYDIRISEAPITPTQLQETGQQLFALAQSVALLGKDIYSIVVPYIPGLKLADKKKLQSLLSPSVSDEQLQQQQKVAALAMEATQARIDKDKAEANYKLVSADRERATAVKTINEAQQVDMENYAIKRFGVDSISLSV